MDVSRFLLQFTFKHFVCAHVCVTGSCVVTRYKGDELTKQ